MYILASFKSQSAQPLSARARLVVYEMLQGVTAGLLLPLALLAAVVLAVAVPSKAFVFGTQPALAFLGSIVGQHHRSIPRHLHQPPPLSTFCSGTSITTTTRHYALPPDYQEQGNQIIREAARRAGVVRDDLLSIEWTPGCIVCTVSGDDVYLSAPLEDGLLLADDEVNDVDVLSLEEEELLFDNDDDDDDDDAEDTMNAATPTILSDEFTASDGDSNSSNGQIDMAVLARAINAALDESGSIGLQIAESHEIQVTTAGASDELRGNVMFRAYRGFDVTVQYQDRKQQQRDKIKTVQGRLVERNDEYTVINIKGRVKNFKNSDIVSVRLPKAKKEKGAR